MRSSAHVCSNKRSNLQSIILEVPADIYKNINVKPCANSAGFGHNSAKCKNKITCLRCAGAHKTELCNSENNLKSANCFFINNKYTTNYNFNHESTDSDMCDILKNKIKNYIDAVVYRITGRFSHVGSNYILPIIFGFKKTNN